MFTAGTIASPLSRALAGLLLAILTMLSPVSGLCGAASSCEDAPGSICCNEFDNQDSPDTDNSGQECSPECWGCGLSLFTVPDLDISTVQSREILYLIRGRQIPPSMKLPPPDQPPRAVLS